MITRSARNILVCALVFSSLSLPLRWREARADSTPPAGAAATAKPLLPPITLEEAEKGLKGKGGLTAKIEVEYQGTPPIKGSFTCQLFADKTPHTVANFVGLARGLVTWTDGKSGEKTKRPLYDGTLFHRVIPNFMIQGGDPDGTGRGGPGYFFDDEIKSELVFDKGGLLAMANRGIDRATGHGTNGSQFFITEKETAWLNGRHTIFGQCEPLELEQKLARVAANPQNRPDKDVVIKKVVISRGRR